MKQALKKIKDAGVTPVIDLIIGKTMSKKLMVFLMASFFLASTFLTGEEWITVSKWYIGTQGLVDGVAIVKGIKKERFSEDE